MNKRNQSKSAAEATAPERASTQRETRGIPRVTRAEEKALGAALRRGRQAERKLAARGLPRPNRWRLRREVLTAREARERLVLGNLGLVHTVIRRRFRGLMPYEDLVHEGVIGLCVAADRWDGRRRFGTFAIWQIRGALNNAVRSHARLVRLSARQEERAYQLRQAVRRVGAEAGRHPDTEDLARATGLTSQAVQAAWLAQRAVLSLDAGDARTGRPLGELIAVDGEVEEQAARAAGVTLVEDFIAGLPHPGWRREARMMAGLIEENGRWSQERRLFREGLRRYLAHPAHAGLLAALAGSMDLALGLHEERLKGRGSHDD